MSDEESDEMEFRDSETQVFIVNVPRGETSQSEEPSSSVVEVGQWYHIQKDEDSSPEWLGCVIHIGSNYIQFKGIERSTRIHFDDFWNWCKKEERPDELIANKINHHQAEVKRLMNDVRTLTARLGVAPSQELTAGVNETKALAVINSDQNFNKYRKDLALAKKETLPELFEEIRRENRMVAAWMTAQVIPLEAEANKLHGVLNAVTDRIFSVELYAGLSENVVQIAKGEPAPLTTPIHLLQRRHYMDEECLLNYQTGGMEFKDIRAFDKWLAKKENRDRILPFPRCVVAFRVRREGKQREIVDLSDFLRFKADIEGDEATFIFMRNGNQIFRMSTSIDFDEKLFPDTDRSNLQGTSKIWAYRFASDIDKLISDNEYKAICEEDAKKHAEWKEKMRLKKEAKKRGEKVEPDGPWDWEPRAEAENYSPFDKTNIYYDDIAEMIDRSIKDHNRIALIMQGLLDRSPVFHPHPPWQIWTNDGFKSAISLVYDQTRALVAGEEPDFEAYRTRLNESITEGTVTVGQDAAWEIAEAVKECARMDNNWRTRGEWRPKTFRPYGNPGPGVVARVAHYQKTSGKCTFKWDRDRIGHLGGYKPEKIPVSFTCPKSKLLNIDAYKPGDFKQFFNDPRTRADYLQWAPLMLTAEEYHAGNRKLPDAPLKKGPSKPTAEGQRRYWMRKKRKELMGKAVRLNRDVNMQNGKTYESGSLWRVTFGSGTTVNIMGIKPTGEWDEYEKDDEIYSRRSIHSLSFSSVDVDLTIPPEPPRKKKED